MALPAYAHGYNNDYTKVNTLTVTFEILKEKQFLFTFYRLK